jgi:hypothetical protein
MRTEKLTAMQTDELLDLIWLRLVRTTEEEILVLAELGARYLTPKQKALVRHLVPVARRQYDYRVSSLNGSV